MTIRSCIIEVDYLKGATHLEYPLLPKKMPERIQNVWRKSNIITTAILTIIGIAGTILLYLFELLSGIWLWVVGIAFALIILFFIIRLLLIPYRYHFYRYEITAEDLAFQKGFIFRSITYVPISRIQHVETEQGPLLRRENLMEIVIHTAASAHRIAGLDLEEAMELRNQIIELVKAVREDV